MILDFHCHMGKSAYAYRHQEFTAEQLIQRMDEAKVDMSCCFSFLDLVDNDYVVDAVKTFDRLLAFAFVNPRESKAADKLAKWAQAKAVWGVKLHPFIHGYHANNTVLLDPIYELCQAYNLPIICHGFADNPFTMPSAFGDMAGRFPKVDVVMAHGGFMWGRRDAVEESARHPNLYLGTSCLLPMGIRDGIKQIGAEKYVFETDVPWGDARPEIVKLQISAHNDREVEQILWENGARLLGLADL